MEKEMATHSSVLAWKIPWTEEPGGLQSTGSQRVRHDWAKKHFASTQRCFNSWCLDRWLPKGRLGLPIIQQVLILKPSHLHLLTSVNLYFSKGWCQLLVPPVCKIIFSSTIPGVGESWSSERYFLYDTTMCPGMSVFSVPIVHYSQSSLSIQDPCSRKHHLFKIIS